MAIQSRRDFLVASALTIGSFVVSTGFSGCKNKTQSKATFEHGVASGDPLIDRVIIWTRLTPSNNINTLNVFYEVALDEAFENLVRPQESATVYKENDYTLKVDFQNLDPNTHYFYRFKVGNTYSPTGRMKTLPIGATSQVKLGVFSCANYPNGHFNAYQEAAQLSDLDATLHLGDYIYEYGMFESDGVTPAYATKHAADYGRELPSDNDTELLTLNDYRKRYALYHTDPGLQAIHAACPMIAVWDDHEVANDSYKDGAQNHNDGEGDYTQRKLAALQAYFEWLPIRPVMENDTETIYRSFTFGDLVNLHMLDTRIIGRDIQLSYSDFPELFQGDSSAFITALSDSNRSIMGNDQTLWLQQQLGASSTTWDVLAQQVLMGRMLLPAELLGLIGQLDHASESDKPQLLAQLNALVTELYTIKMRMNEGDPSLTPQEIARVSNALPYNLDSWDGY
ncbi:MAG TPA: alkaline phosphatase, partial [Helicobacteraceae bacterium]|nr:alkaline phosphatase [Helicobacteraceae bacterium]